MSEQQEPQILCTLDDLRTVTREAVEQTLTTLGVDCKNPLSMQQDFAHLREWRLAMESVRRKGLLVITGLLVSGLVAAVLVGIKEQVRHLLNA